MRFSLGRKKIILFSGIILMIALFYLQIFLAMPEELVLFAGEEFICNVNSPIFATVRTDKENVLTLDKILLQKADVKISLFKPFTLVSKTQGAVKLSFKAFGLFPLKTMQIDILPIKKVMACGSTVGVKLSVNGLLVVGVSEVENPLGNRVSPAEIAGIKPGDILKEADDEPIKDVELLIKKVDTSLGKAIRIKYKRDTNLYTTELTPVIDKMDQKYHLGVWIRDSTAGIGTLTFYDTQSSVFGALGHGVNDVDTGSLILDCIGEIFPSKIMSIKKGKKGYPGELRGVFSEENQLGNITINSENGIYGILGQDSPQYLPAKEYNVGLRSQIKEGEAKILTNIEGNEINEYKIMIEKVYRRTTNSTKGMLIKILDKRLLSGTGGIVQGMSGSPIIQDDKIIGAITHVLVNDPERGFGTFIESMIGKIQSATIHQKISGNMKFQPNNINLEYNLLKLTNIA